MDKKDRVGLGSLLAAIIILLQLITPTPDGMVDSLMQIASGILAMYGLFLMLREE